MSRMKWWMHKYDNMNYINKNYALKSIYNDENKCINEKSSKHHIRITMNKFHFNEHKWDSWKYDWLICYIISIKHNTHKMVNDNMLINIIKQDY